MIFNYNSRLLNSNAFMNKNSMLTNKNTVVQPEVETQEMQKNLTTEENKENSQVTTQEQTNEHKNNSIKYEDTVVLESGKKTKYSYSDGKTTYYYENMKDAIAAKLLVNPEEKSVGKAKEEQQWGQKTDYFIEMGNSKWYFESYSDYIQASLLKPEHIKDKAIGRYSFPEGDETITSASDAVVDIEGEKTEFYIDRQGTRYYYASKFDAEKACVENGNGSYIGKAEVMRNWGRKSDYYIDYQNKKYYFANEDDKKDALKFLNDEFWLTSVPEKFDKLLIGVFEKDNN